MSNTVINNSGEKLSFFKLVSDKNYFIEIPIIQRDYAQGRDSASEVRINFLNSLFDDLNSGLPIDLDFIYGSVTKVDDHHKFIPLDGQQRLTTLFLLHWYLSLKENRLSEFRDVITNGKSSKFTYETRITSRDFCNALVSNDILIPLDKTKKLSEVIKDASWFFLSWENDPTIVSMLNMLDAINIKFYDSRGFYDKLTNIDNPIISFQFIELKNFGLSDSLYIKMNARGKELTPFENFKAKFEQLLEKQDKENKTQIRDEFSLKIDTVWTDLFWNYKNSITNLFDDELSNFIRVVTTNNYASRMMTGDYFDHLELLIGEENSYYRSEKSKQIDFYKYEELNCFEPKCINEITQTLDLLKNGSNKIRTYLTDDSYINEEQLFDKVIKNDLTYTQRIQFYAHYNYLIFNNKSETNLKDWMRIIRNLSENTIYNDVEDYAKDIKAIKNLLPHSNSIIDYISDPNNKIPGFIALQAEEEKLKAILIKKSEIWKKSIVQIENHGYFKGQIGFILKFSGITDYYIANKHLGWSEKENDEYFNSFSNYVSKSSTVFNKDGLHRFKDNLWERALLCKGDYLLAKGKNQSFLKDLDRDISWKRLLRNDTTNRNFVKELFDSININAIEQDLLNIIANFNQPDWRYYFIAYTEMIAACGSNKFIRKEGESNILLLEKTQTNGTHRECYSYALSLKLSRLGNKVRYVESNSIDYLKYISNINGKKIMLSFEYYTDAWKYRIKEGDSETFFNAEKDVIGYLKANSFIS